jgi:hypothetical protein
MTKEELTAELEKLKTQRETAVANVHVLNGAIQFAEIMLAKFSAPQPALATPATSP